MGKRDQTGCGVWRSCLGQEFTFLFSGVMRRLDIRGFWDVMGCVSDVWDKAGDGGMRTMKNMMGIEDISGGRVC